MKLEWDPAKAQANLEEHQVSFSEATTVLEDEFSLTREDPDAEGEQRFVTLGMSSSATCWWSSTPTENRTAFA